MYSALIPGDERVKKLEAKCLQQVEDCKRWEKESFTLKRANEVLTRERDAARADATRSRDAKDRVEKLCRELQKQNKAVLEESHRMAAEEHTRRQELSQKFNATIQDISVKLDENGEERQKQFKENDMLREKLKGFAEQFELREAHHEAVRKSMSLEKQLAEAKFNQASEMLARESAKADAYREQALALAATEKELRAQLSLYGDKFTQFQETLTKSNDVFASFKKELDQNAKTIKALNKENLAMKKKISQSDVALVQLVDERTTATKALAEAKAAKEKLEGLCRTLQAERTSMKTELEELKKSGGTETGNATAYC